MNVRKQLALTEMKCGVLKAVFELKEFGDIDAALESLLKVAADISDEILVEEEKMFNRIVVADPDVRVIKGGVTRAT